MTGNGGSEPSPLRLAVSGCAGIGKTALATALRDLLGAELIAEGYEPLFAPAGLKGPPQRLAARFEQILDAKGAAALQATRVVADRCGADLFNLWLAHRLHQLPARTAAFAAAGREATEAYDLVIFPPWDELPLKPHDAPDGRVRVQNRWVQLRNHAAILGLANLWLGPGRVLEMPPGLGSAARLAAWLTEQLQGRGLAPEGSG